jgi:hypothetical protein
MKSKQFLFFAALGCTAAPVAAQTVDVSIDCGQTYAINSTVNATAGDGLTYRWLENGSTITGATANYTVPATKSVGLYTYIRQAKSTGCTDWQSSNPFTVEVKNKEGIDGVCLVGLMWAKYNVDEPGQFAAHPDSMGRLYEFNNPIPYPWGSPGSWTLPSVTYTAGWLPENDPCPEGWRIPSRDETQTLCSLQHTTTENRVYHISTTAPCTGDCSITVQRNFADPNNRACIWTHNYVPEGGYTYGYAYQYLGPNNCWRTAVTYATVRMVRCVSK